MLCPYIVPYPRVFLIQQNLADGTVMEMASYIDDRLSSLLDLLVQVFYFWLMLVPTCMASLLRKVLPEREKDLSGKVVLVTGAGNGLGKELSLQLAVKHGCRVICVDIRKADNDQTVKDIQEVTGDKNRARGYICDISNTASVEELRKNVLADFDKVDVLINNAAVVYSNTIHSGSEEQIRRVVDINLLGPYWVTRSFIPEMKERNEGHIVFINSIGALNAAAKASTYCSTKSGLLAMAMSLEEDLRQSKSNVKVTSVHPYFMATNEAYSQYVKSRVPALSTTEAARMTITGIRREYLTFQVPGNELGYNISVFATLLPVKLYHIVRDLVAADMIESNHDEDSHIPSRNIDECDSYVKIFKKDVKQNISKPKYLTDKERVSYIIR